MYIPIYPTLGDTLARAELRFNRMSPFMIFCIPGQGVPFIRCLFTGIETLNYLQSKVSRKVIWSKAT